MKLKHRSTIRNFDGTIDIDVAVINKSEFNFKCYSYHLASEFAARKFHQMYRKGYYGKALTILNKFNIKENVNESISR